MTHYEPIKDATGAVIGIFFVGNNLALQQAALEKQIANVRFFETGGVYFINARESLAQARFVVHPSTKDQKVLTTYPQAEAFLMALAADPQGYASQAPSIFSAVQEDK